jgi:uncharacterized protein (DUF1499 family)
MSPTFALFPTPFAKWSRIVALFGVQLILLGLLLHRFGSLPTPVVLNLFNAAFVVAALAIALGIIAAIVIWRLGRSGTWSAATGVLIGLAIFAWPAAYLPFALSLPQLNDVTTDPLAPPRFITLAKVRPKDANPIAYAGPAVAKLQAEHYPDLRPLMVPRKIDETFEIVRDTVRRLKWTVVAEELPQGKGRPGYIEAVDRTLIVGFYDDVVIRLDGDQRESRIDVRSASRYGRHDLGRNAARVRRLFAELQTQLDQNVPGLERRRRRKPRVEDAVPKRQKGAPAASLAQPSARGPGQPGAQRGQPPKEKLRSKGEAQARDKRPPQSQR